MTIFGDSRIGRIGYAIVLILMFSFDFAKAPVEHYIMRLHDQTAEELMKPHAVQPGDISDAGTINGRQMPLMLEGQEDAIRDIVNSKTKLSRAEIEKRLEAATRKSVQKFETNSPAGPNIGTLADDRLFYETLYPIAVIVMTGITVVGLLWMVSSRLRDIGWPQALLWVLLAPVFVPKFVHVPLPEMAVHAISLFFYTAIFALAFIPGESTRSAPPRLELQPQATPARRSSSQFGRLGTQ